MMLKIYKIYIDDVTDFRVLNNIKFFTRHNIFV